MTLSDVMRYALSENATGPGKVPLQEEIEHLHNVIKVNQLRFNNDLNLKFEVKGMVEGFMVPPFVLITVVENAFKHGTSEQLEKPWLGVDIAVKQDILRIKIANSKNEMVLPNEKGIGVQNVKKRLALLYPGKYQLEIQDGTGWFIVNLKICV